MAQQIVGRTHARNVPDTATNTITLDDFASRRPDHVIADDNGRSVAKLMNDGVFEPVPDDEMASVKAAAEARGIKWLDGYEQRVKRWIASDDRVDRDGDIVMQDWRLDDYRRNPVLLWAHNMHEPPIGVSLRESKTTITDPDTGREHQALALDLLFAGPEVSEDADKIFRLVDAGFIRTGSVRFDPKSIEMVEDDERRAELGLGRWGYVFHEPALVEFSIVSVPANVGAEAIANAAKAMKAGRLQQTDVDLLKKLAGTDDTDPNTEGDMTGTANDEKTTTNQEGDDDGGLQSKEMSRDEIITLVKETVREALAEAANEAANDSNDAAGGADSSNDGKAAGTDAKPSKEYAKLEAEHAKTRAELDELKAERKLDQMVAKVKAAGSGHTDEQIRKSITQFKGDEAREVQVNHLITMAKIHAGETDDTPPDDQTRRHTGKDPAVAKLIEEAVKSWEGMKDRYARAGKEYRHTLQAYVNANFPNLKGVNLKAYGVADELLKPAPATA